jgi:hypothetical protein
VEIVGRQLGYNVEASRRHPVQTGDLEVLPYVFRWRGCQLVLPVRLWFIRGKDMV